MGKHADKLKLLVDNLSDQNAELRDGLQRFGLQLGIYQGIFGEIPADVVAEVVTEMNAKTDKATTISAFVRDVRAIAALKSQKAVEPRIEGVTPAAPTPAPSRSPYTALGAESATPPVVLGTARTAPADSAPLSGPVVDR